MRIISRKTITMAAALACSTWQSASAQSGNTFIDTQLDAYIQQGLQDWDVPGLAIVIVKDGRVVKMQGYGYADLTTKRKVDTQTHFFIASNTKLFTGLALANLQAQGKINLDDPVRKYLPYFRLYDSLTTPLVTVRDMLSHRIGTKTFQGDFTFWNTSLTSAQIMGRMALMQPSAVFRQTFGYCNSCYMVAGEVVPKVLNQSWAQYVQDSLLAPIGMRNSYAKSNGIEKKLPTMATPYTTNFVSKATPVPFDRWDNMGAAASIVSNVEDMGKWLLFQLDSGRVEGRQVIPWVALRETRQINTVTSSQKSLRLPVNFSGYGLGLDISDLNGRQVYGHTGGAGGMISAVGFIPDERVGVAVFSNNDNHNLTGAIRQQVLDAFAGVPFVNRSTQGLDRFVASRKKQLDEIAGWHARTGKMQPPLPLEAYAGSYKNKLYGAIELRAEGNKLVMKLPLHPDMLATLRYMDNGEWLLEYDNPVYGIFSLRFETEADQVKRFWLPCNDFVEYDAYLFERIF